MPTLEGDHHATWSQHASMQKTSHFLLYDVPVISKQEFCVELVISSLFSMYSFFSLRLPHRNYLSGFRKRKSDRSKVAKKNIDRKLLKERKYVQKPWNSPFQIKMEL
jgi:hypothetical protein